MSLTSHRLLWIIGLILLVVVQYRIWFDDSGVISTRALDMQVERLKEDIQVQQTKNEQLLREVEDLRQGSAVLEEKAREDLGLIKKGETLILFVEPEQ